MSVVWEKRLLLFALALVVTLLTILFAFLAYTSSQDFLTNLPMPTDYEYKVFDARLQLTDVPLRYRSRITHMNDDMGGVYGQRYIVRADQLGEIASIFYGITIFETPSAAEQALNNYAESLGKLSLQEIGGTNTQGRPFSASRLVSGCRSPNIVSNTRGWSAQTRWCVTVGLYGNVFIRVNGDIFAQDELLTQADYEQLIEVIDARVAKVFNRAK